MPFKSPDPNLDLSAVPLFPLPNVVLFPSCVLPLHIFEERYKAMTRDALQGGRLIAMTLLKPGWQHHHLHRPQIDPVVCIGKITSEHRLPDGKYNFLLQGLLRARIVAEHPPHPSQPYRTAHLEPFAQSHIMEIDVVCRRQQLTDLFTRGLLAYTPVAAQFRDILSSPFSTAQIADLAAFHLLEDIPLKQSLLAESDVDRRITRVLDALRHLIPPLPAPTSFGNQESCN